MVTFTKTKCNFLSQRKWVNNTYLGIRLLLALIILSSSSVNLFAQNATYCDGNPTDWTAVLNNAGSTHIIDVANASGNIDNQFTQGAKDGDKWLNSSTRWHWSLGSANAKGDIQNGGAALVDGCILRFFGDRTAVNGDAGIGFWFFKDQNVSLNANGTFNGTHTNGDVLILVDFLGGGGTAVPTTYEWLNGSLVELTSVTGCGITNSSAIPGSDIPWDYDPKFGSGYPIGAFFEGYVNLCGSGLSLCFNRFLVETRNSQELTASLQDFVLGNANISPGAPSVTPASLCGPGSVTLGASGCTGGTLNWYQTNTSTTVLSTGSSFNTGNLTQTTDFYVACNVSGCEGPRTKVTATIIPNPGTPSLTIVNPTCSTSTGSITVTSPLNPSSGDPIYEYSFDGGATYGSSVGPVSFAAGGGYSVTVRRIGTTCTSSASCAAEVITTNTGVSPSKNQVQTIDTYKARIEAPTKVLAAPNPFNDRIRFTLESAVSGRGSLELYNMVGQRVKTVYEGYVEAGKVQTIEYSVPRVQRNNLIYIFRVGNQRTSGKLIGLK